MVNWPWLMRKHQLFHLQWCVTLKEISICTDFYVEPFVATIEEVQHSANTVGVKFDSVAHKSAIFKYWPFTGFSQ